MGTKVECRELIVHDNIGICKRLECICKCYDCEFKEKCHWQLECYKRDLEKVENADNYYCTASRKLRDTIRNRIRQIPPKELYGGLLYRREDSLLRAFTVAQGDIVDACLVSGYLKEMPALSSSDIRPSERTIDLCNIMTFKHVLDLHAKMIENNDMIIFATKEGLDSLSRLANKPLDSISQTIQKMTRMMKKDTKEEEIPPEHLIEFWSLQMCDSYKWCKQNSIPIRLDAIQNNGEFAKIQEHMGELGSQIGKRKKQKIVLDKRKCYEITYPLYTSLVYVCRYLFSRFSAIRKTIHNMEKAHINPLLAFRSLEIENWDSLAMDAFFRQRNMDFIFDFKTPVLCDWPLKIEDGSFWASTLLMAFIQRNINEITIDRLELGWTFEKKVRNELIDRNVTILKENLPTPFGDIDFVCEEKEEALAIEAKDYGPWYRDWYVSSKAFAKRKTVLERRLSLIPKRINWVEKNKEKTGIRKTLRPLVISKTKEEMSIKCLTLNDLDDVFGPSRFPEYKETLPKFVSTDDSFVVQVMGRNLHFPPRLLMGKFNGKELVGRQCPIHPMCICLYLEDNPWLHKSGGMAKLCRRLQVTTGGGPCPNLPAFCMWAGFCIRSIDPTPYVEEFSEIFKEDRGTNSK